MRYQILNQDADLSLIERLLKVRNISDNIGNFLNPTLANYWLDPFLLNDMDKGVDRIIQALKNKEKIVVFWDYDVDWITASYTLYKFITKYLNYKNITIRYPNRIEDGYWMKPKHLDEMKKEGVDLVITVDNWITSLAEAEYAKELWITLIITDHHHALDTLPDAYAVINPQVSPDYPFKGLAGVWVAFKVLNAMLLKSTISKEVKNEIFNYFLPIIAIGTVADVVPLVDENRVIVKRWLEIMNHHPESLPRWLAGFLKFLNIKWNIDTFHIWFVIGPRINAWGRLESPYDSLKVLLCEDENQEKYIQKIEDINTERRRMQDQAFRIAEKQYLRCSDHGHLHAEDERFGSFGGTSQKQDFSQSIDRQHLCSQRSADHVRCVAVGGYGFCSQAGDGGGYSRRRIQAGYPENSRRCT